MTTTRNTILTMLAMVLAVTSVTSAQQLFRGIPLDQGSNVQASEGMLNRSQDFYIDVLDNFSGDGPLSGREADTHRIGFVPPVAGVPNGLLQGAAADAHGRWIADSDYIISNGRVVRETGVGQAIAQTPWRAFSGLGDDYKLEATAMVAAGETVSIGYFGESDGSQGLNSDFGQLVLGLTRGIDANENTLDWSVAWDDNGIRQTVTGTTTAALDEEINLQLGWLDTGAASDDLFDAIIGTSNGNQRLIQDSMGNAIDVFAVGFESGANSSFGSFTAAVPEPNTAMLAIFGIIGMVTATRRRA